MNMLEKHLKMLDYRLKKVKVKKIPRPKPNSMNGVNSVVAGGLTGAINISICYPTEFIKTQLQLDAGKNIVTAHHSIMAPYRATVLESKHVKAYKGSVDVASKIIKQHGIRGLYRGVSVLLMGAVPTYAVRFGVFDWLKSRFSKADGNLSPVASLGCGLGSGVAEAVLIVTFADTLKARVIAEQKKKVPQFRGVFNAVSFILRKEGFSALYKGFSPTVVRQASSQAIRFTVMESLRSWYTQGDPTIKVQKPVVALFGVVAGVTCVLANTPVDVVKTRMQNSNIKSVLGCACQVARREGFKGFYKGCIPRMSKVSLEVSLAFCIYDFLAFDFILA